ncbi:hypothetical protein Ga0609869_002627 [Rhodovulum iodosum]|uniref:DUF2793 domain-containing protein n=1 Tax=Rhodovulum iodosum TaxID=68291 RepID=A0ABV3XW64_9RHOB|nr:DUF2793 domain-containing protein [Rhodovulum robiginosum]RSK33544.1 DUF2793 domain-containing protein [Rhodovulum robiginosum]
MSDTANLQLPLVQAAQAQKHVTVNEALLRLDALVQLRLQSVEETTPPVAPADGDAWGVPAGAVNDWEGQQGRVAIADNGGWVFVQPLAGWRAWVLDRGGPAVFDGALWVRGLTGHGVFGAGLRFETLDIEHDIVAGGAQDTGPAIPSHAMVFGVTGRVREEITGTLTSWRLGADGSDNRFGSGMGLAVGSYAIGTLSAPLTHYAPLPLTLTPEGGEFAGGKVRLAVHYCALSLPDL